VLYSATVTEKPVFDSFQRIPHSSFERFVGIYDGYESSDDSYYVNHPTHRNKRSNHGVPVGQGIITKWKLNTQATIFDGEKGRGADNFQKDPIYLEVFSKGTVITTYEEISRTVTDKDGDGKVTGSHVEKSIDKDETEFVDRVVRIEFSTVILFLFF
jgi:hypothetical protein